MTPPTPTYRTLYIETSTAIPVPLPIPATDFCAVTNLVLVLALWNYDYLRSPLD